MSRSDDKQRNAVHVVLRYISAARFAGFTAFSMAPEVCAANGAPARFPDREELVDLQSCNPLQIRPVDHPHAPAAGMTTLTVTTRHPQDYVLVNESDGTRWRADETGRWQAAPEKSAGAQ